MIKQIKLGRGAIFFSLFKYLEVGIIAATTFLVAKKIGPDEMGKAMPVLLYITYSNYLSLGINQVIVKNYSRFKDEVELKEFVKINLQYMLLISFINVFVAYIFVDFDFFLVAAMVSIGTLMRSFFTSYFRAIDKIWVLNKNEIIFSFLFFLLTLVLVENLKDYLLYWWISLWIGLLFYLIDGRAFFFKIVQQLFVISKKDKLISNLKEGIKLASAGFLTTILLTADRFVINRLDFALGVKGSYQLADYVGAAFYLGVTTIIFYFYPKLITRLRENADFRKVYINYIKLSAKIFPVIIILTYLVSSVGANWFFKEYNSLSYFITLSVALKSCVILVTSFSIYYVALDKEVYYIRTMLAPVAIYILLSVLFVKVIHPSIYWVPSGFIIVLFLDFIYKLIRFEKN